MKYSILRVSDDDLSQLLSRHPPRLIWWAGLPPDPDDLHDRANSVKCDIFVYDECADIEAELLDISSCDLACTTAIGYPEYYIEWMISGVQAGIRRFCAFDEALQCLIEHVPCEVISTQYCPDLDKFMIMMQVKEEPDRLLRYCLMLLRFFI